jgi:hypothetical protein
MADPGDGDIGEEMDARTRLMRIVAEEMDGVEAEFGDSYRIGRVITIFEVLKPDEGEGQAVGLRVRAGQFPWVAIGILEVAKKIVEGQIPRGGSED